MEEPTKARLAASSGRRYPLARANSATARPLSWALAKAGATPNQVTLLSLVVSLVGLWVVAAADAWTDLAAGVALVHLGLVLDHADGQVARRRGMGSDWGLYLDMVVDRVVEIGLVVALAVTTLTATQPLPDTWLIDDTALAMLALATLGLMLSWRFLNAYNDVLYLRRHLLVTGRAPQARPSKEGGAAGGWFPVFNRDWVFALWSIGALLVQPAGTLAVLAVLHLGVCAGKVLAFKRHHEAPEARAAAVLDGDHH
ncbi:MAG: CDP-alcohol phosphatidyltransferase family protein [Thermoplasmatota archaeon]